MGETEKALSMIQLAKRRATELGLTDHAINAINAGYQFRNLDVDGERDIAKALKYVNEQVASVDALENQPDLVPEARSLVDIAKTVLAPLRNPNFSFDSEDSLINLISTLNNSLEQIAPWLESVIPASHPIHTQLMGIRSIQQSTVGNTTLANEQLESALRRLDADADSNHPHRYPLLKMMALNAVKVGDEEKALDLYIQILEIHDSSAVRDSDHRANANLEIAKLLKKRENLDAAVEFYTNVIEIPHLSASSYYIQEALWGRADIYEKQKKWGAALADYLRWRGQSQRDCSGVYERVLFLLDTYTIPRLRQKIRENDENDS